MSAEHPHPLTQAEVAHVDEGILMDDSLLLLVELAAAVDRTLSDEELRRETQLQAILDAAERHCREMVGVRSFEDVLDRLAGEIQRRRRREAVQLAREALERDPVDPAFWAQLLTIIAPEDVLQIWMTGRNGWLSTRRPLDVWRDDPEAVLAAARRAVESPAL